MAEKTYTVTVASGTLYISGGTGNVFYLDGVQTPTSMTIGLTGQSMTSTVGTGFILKYFGKLTPKDSTGYTTKTPKNTTGYTTKVAN